MSNPLARKVQLMYDDFLAEMEDERVGHEIDPDEFYHIVADAINKFIALAWREYYDDVNE